MSNLISLSDNQLHAGYRAYAQEIERRHELRRIPEQITELATQGRQIGVEEQVMVEAVTKHPEPEPE